VYKFYIWISLSTGSGSLGSSSAFSGAFTAEEVKGEGDKGSGDTTMVDVWTLLKAFFLTCP
jgi:hypothetical protein